MADAIAFPDLAYLCKLVHAALQLPVFCVTDADPNEEFWYGGSLAHPYYSEKLDLSRSVARKEARSLGPILHETNYMEQFAVVPVKRNGLRQAVMVIGPTTSQEPKDELCTKLMNDYGIPSRERPKWTAYWRALPIMNRLTFLHLCVAVHWMLNQEVLDVTDVFQSSLQYGAPNRQKENELALADRREFSIFHEGLDGASEMLALIRTGNKTELMKKLATVTHGDKPAGVHSKRSHLRSVKNLAIGGIALSSRAAVEGGLNEELSVSLSDLHIQRIEEMNELSSVQSAAIAAIVDFAGRVEQCRKSMYSKPVQASKEYIYLHLFEEITLQQLSVVSGLNANYLSQLFKKETGLTLINFIQKERIEEAKKLLDHSNDSISRIGERLTFYDQAHFAKVFKKHAGLTPKQYRNRNR